MDKLCIECKKEYARYWQGSFCEHCFRELLRKDTGEYYSKTKSKGKDTGERH